jgi:GNAT superfamily N-acetyltransferase
VTNTIEAGFTVRPILPDDIPRARALMIRTFDEDFGTQYDPAFHVDADNIDAVYVKPRRHALFVAVDDATNEVIGTGGVRGGALSSDKSPELLVRRYDGTHTAQIVRVYTLREHRRRGVARAIVRGALEFILADRDYSIIALHTYPHSPGAMAFWESIGNVVFRDQRDPLPPVVYFEIPIDSARMFVESGNDT